RVLDAPLATGVLRREVDTSSQVSAATRAERLRNVRDAFAAVRSLDGGAAVLVDDVTTTGATLSAAAHALRSAGAERVYALTFAHEE
ncbi:MAG: phosphoribosyltransferase family protein, partial [Chloroflexi bacterium]|nr:phosphoribosyltransferase family protein [Chloroflexota bacterium]